MADQISITAPRAVDRNGEPQGGAKLYSYISGTETALVLTDEADVPLAWPLEADANGVFPQVFYSGPNAVRIIITDDDDVVLPGYPIDPAIRVPVLTTAASGVTFTASADVPETDVQAAIDFLGDRVADIAAAEIEGDGLASVTGTLETGYTVTVSAASKAQAEVGTNNVTAMTPLRTAQAIAVLSPLGREYVSPEQVITSAGQLVLTHGLEEVPKLVAYDLVCVTDQAGFVTGDRIAVDFNSSSETQNRPNIAKLSDEAITIRFTDNANCFLIADADTGVAEAATNINWKLVVRAWA